MNAVIEFSNAAGEWFVSFALPMLIQSSVLILLILGIDFLIRKRVRAVFRYGLWMLVLIKLMLPTSLSSPTGLGYWFAVPTPEIPPRTVPADAQPQEFPSILLVNPSETVIQRSIEPIVYPVEWPESPNPMTPTSLAVEEGESLATASAIDSSPDITWQAVVLLVWLIVVVIMLLLLMQRVFFVRGLVTQAQDAKGAVVSVLHQCRGKMGISKEVPIKFSANATSPSVCGLWKPVILFPRHLVSQLSRAELEAVLLHELSHIKRRDLWVNLWQTILQILYFYHPLFWLANMLMRRVREQAVDEAVLVAMQREAEEYSNTLVRVFRMSLRRPAFSLRLIGVVESKKSLATRIKHMLSRPLPKSAKLGILGVLMVCLLGMILLPMAEARRVQTESQTGVSRENADIDETAELEFGPVIEGVHCRLESKRSTWHVREAPQFLVVPRAVDDNADLLLSASVLYGCQVEVDGKWYDYWAPQEFTGPAYIPCRQMQAREQGLDLTLTPHHYHSVKEKRALVLPVGKHTVRFAWAAYRSDYKTHPPEKRPPLQVVSNPVEIKILPIENEFLQQQAEKYFREAQTGAQAATKNPEYTIECIRKALQYPQSDINRAQLYVYWGDSIQIQTPNYRPEVWGPQRQKAAEIYLEGLHEVLKHNLPANPPELPVVERYNVDGPPEIVEKYRKINELQVQARNEAMRIHELIQHRQALTGQLVQMYAREPDAFGELNELIVRYLHSNQAAKQIIAAAKDYRKNPKTPFPAIVLEPGRNYQFWGNPVDGVQCRLRAEKSTWPQGSIPKLFADLRNRGQQNLRIALESESWELEIDGQWHKPNTGWSGRRRYVPLSPGQQQQNLEVWLPTVDNLAQQLQTLPPGKHTLRIARLFNDPWRPADEVLRVVSNPVEIEIVEELDQVMIDLIRAEGYLYGASSIWIGYEQLSEDVLRERIKRLLKGPPNQKVIIRADQSVPFKDVANLQNILKTVGVKNISLAVFPLNSVFVISPGPGRDGVIRGKVIAPDSSGENINYVVLLDHELWTNRLGELPNMEIAAGETFEFRNVPAGKCKVRAQPVFPVGRDNARTRKIVTVEVMVINKQVIDVELNFNEIQLTSIPIPSRDGVQVSLLSTKQVWNQDDDPAFKVTIRNNGTRELKTSQLASLALEIDGKPYAPRTWWYRGRIGVMPFGPGKEYHLDIKLSQFAADRKAADELPPGKHTIKAVYLNNNSADGRGLTTSLSRYQEMALGYSDPVEISIILAEAKWGQLVNGLRAAVEFIPEKASYTQGESVAVHLHIQNVSDSDIEFKSLSTRQDYAQVKDQDGNDIKVQRRFHSGTVYTRIHTIKPSEVLLLKTTGLGFTEIEDQTLDEFKSKQDYYVGSILRSKPGTYAIHYNVNRDLKTGIRKVKIVEKPQIEAKRITMKEVVQTLARKYRVRLCFEDITDMVIADIALQPYRLTGNFKAQTIPPLLDQLTQSGPFAWVKYNDTYVVYPRENSLLESSISIDISGPLESVARKVLDKIPAGKEIEIKSPVSVVPDANKQKNIHHLWISSSPARYALARAVEESGQGDTEIVWTFTQEQGRNHLTFHYLPRRQNSNEPKDSTPAETSAEVSSGVERKVPSGSAQFIKTSMASAAAAPVKEPAGHPGRIRGVVLSAVDRKPVTDAYVGVGDFWDSGGSNHSRHRKEGLYAKTKTDARGRFEVDGLVFSESQPDWDLHMFFVTHPDFIRHDQKVNISENDPVAELEILLRPAAKIHAAVVDENGSPTPGLWLLRLEALDGHRFLAPGGDPHLSAFANSVWTQGPMSRRGQMYSSEFTFTQLTPGEYQLDVIQFRMKKIISSRSDRYAMPWDPTGFTFHGGIAKISAIAGQTIKVKIRPQQFGTTLHVKMPLVANQQEFPELKNIPSLVSLSRNPGLPVWDSDLVYSLEDSRLGRIQEQALFFTMTGGVDSITVRNLPPGVYTVYAGPMMLMNAAKVELTANQTLTAQPPPIRIQKKAGRVNTGQLRRRIQLDSSEYTLQDLCQRFTKQTQSRPRIIAEPTLTGQKIEIKPGSYEIWDLLETLYVERNWKLTEAEKEKQTLVIQSSP